MFRPSRKPTYPMIVPARLVLDDACSHAFKHPQMARQLALKAHRAAVQAGDQMLAAQTIALANVLETGDD